LEGSRLTTMPLPALLRPLSGPSLGLPLPAVTIPRDDDAGQERYTGFAVANPGGSAITIQVYEVSADGSTANSLTPIALKARSQKSFYFIQDPKAAQKPKGSAVVIGRTETSSRRSL